METGDCGTTTLRFLAVEEDNMAQLLGFPGSEPLPNP